MLTPEQVKPLLLHEDRDVRSNASQYFANAGSTDPEIVDLSLQALLKYGCSTGGGYHLVFNLRRLPAGPSSVPLFLAALEKLKSDPIQRDLNWAIGRLPLETWDKHERAILGSKQVTDAAKARIARRRRHAKLDGEQLLIDELHDLANEEEVDDAAVEDVLEALEAMRYPESDELEDMLINASDPGMQYHLFLVELAGLRRQKNVVPLLVEYMGMNDCEMLQDKAERALAMIGDPSAINLIRTSFLRSSWEYKLYAGGVLGAIHEEHAEKTILDLLKWERHPEGRCYLCMALGDQFSHAAIEIIQRELKDDKIADKHLDADLKDILLALSLALGIDIPQRQELLRRRATQDRQVKAVEEKMKVQFPMLGALKMRDEDWDGEEGGEQEDDGYMSPDEFTQDMPHPVEPMIAKRQPRPNDPCPCGSGKKHKKCCGTK